MSIATAITNLQGKIANAYLAIQEKGGTLPQVQNAENLSVTITDIPSGGGSESKWGMSIDEVLYSNNGILSPFAGASGDVDMTGVSVIGNYSGMYQGFAGSPVKSVSFPNLSGVEYRGLLSAFANCTSLSSISFPNLKTTQGSSMSATFFNCTSLSSISFPALLSGNFSNTFVSCTSLTGVSFPNLSSGNFNSAFVSCTSLTGVSFPSLTSGTFDNAFLSCTNLTEVSFPTLVSANTSAFISAFAVCRNLSSVSFPVLTTLGPNAEHCFNCAFAGTNVLSLSFPELTGIVANTTVNTTACFRNNQTSVYYFPKLTVLKKTASATTNNAQYVFDSHAKELHFAAENQAVIEASDYYSDRWGAGSGCQVFFDL